MSAQPTEGVNCAGVHFVSPFPALLPLLASSRTARKRRAGTGEPRACEVRSGTMLQPPRLPGSGSRDARPE